MRASSLCAAFGDPDVLLRVACIDVAEHHRLQDEQLGKLPSVARFNWTLVRKHVVTDRSLRLEAVVVR